MENSSQPKTLVFVYGTLKTGKQNHHRFSNAKFVGEAITSTKYPLVIGGEYFVPYLLNKPNEGHLIKGEVYELDAELLKETDIFESNYTRLPIPLSAPFDKSECSAYFKTIVPDEFWTYPQISDYPYDERYVVPELRNKKN